MSVPAKGLSARGDFRPKEETFLVVTSDGQVRGFCGHVDLGTGIATALAQIVAEELDARPDQVRMVLGHTETTPDQGATIASETIQVSAIPLRQAAAQARLIVLAQAAATTGRDISELTIRDGLIAAEPPLINHVLTLGDVLAGMSLRVPLDASVAVKRPSEYRLVGREMPRVDIPDKVTGKAVYVHDVRVPGMLHGRVVRPPYGGFDHGPFVARALLGIDRSSIAHLPGIVDVVVIGDFVGVVAQTETQAAVAADALAVTWAPIALPDLHDPAEAVRQNPFVPRVVHERGAVEDEIGVLPARLDREYVWPYQMHASIGPSCAVADWRHDGLIVWSGTQNPHMLRADIALLMGVEADFIKVIRHEAAGCYGRNCADDVGGDAALLSRAVGAPVRVQLTRLQEHVWEPKGAAQVMRISGGLDATGSPHAYDFDTRYPSNVSPLLALVLTGIVPSAEPTAVPMGDRTSVPPYVYPHARVTIADMPPIARASWFRGVSALPNSFAHDSYIDELAVEAGCDPLEYRLRHHADPRGAELLKVTAERANWIPRTTPTQVDDTASILRGRGLGYAQYVHGAFPGVPAAWSAWVADVEVDRQTGVVTVTRAVVGQDAGMMVNPAGVRHQLHGNVIQSTSRVLKEEVRFDEGGVESRDWGGYPIITFPEVPQVDAYLVDRPDQPPLGAGESASVPSAAAIANALFDATGVRFRDVPFTPEKVKARLDAVLGPLDPPIRTPLAALPPVNPAPEPALMQTRWQSAFRRGAFAVGFAALGSVFASLLPWRGAIAPISPPQPGLFSADAVARGALLAAAGDCAVCHTSVNGTPNAGGLPLDTPFGTIYTTNLTPDPDTGIGAWSLEAFTRAMRHGISRDGRHLYPAFPYTSFAKTSDTDLQDLYAYLMSQPPVRSAPPQTRLAFPYNLRPAMAGWNALFHDARPFEPDPKQSAEWNRGAYLAEGLGHCSGCHTPRNVLGAESLARAYLDGGEAEGWVAPALTALSKSPLPWTEADLYAYLRTGFSPNHGPAGGPMAPVVHSMAGLPDGDIRAIAHYVASFDTRVAEDTAARRGVALADAQARLLAEAGEGARIYNGSCAACHEGEAAYLFGARPQLALNSNLHADSPGNLLQTVLHGVPDPVHAQTAFMPAYADHLSDRQIAELARFLRRTFAPGQKPWENIEAQIANLRHPQHRGE